MKKIVTTLTENFTLFFLAFSSLPIGYSLLFANHSSFLVILGYCACALIFLEYGLRLSCRLIYGTSWKHIFFLQSLEDDLKLGFKYTKNFNTIKANRPIFDNYLLAASRRQNFRDFEDASTVIFSVNNIGTRGLDVHQKKSFRILCSGGSTTAGYRVNDEESWPALLAEQLKRHDKDVEVINAGVFGWSSFQELLNIERLIETTEPDLILLHQGWNEEFAYSVQALGKNWSPSKPRGATESNLYYSDNSSFYNSMKSTLITHLLTKDFRRRFIFKKNMSFSNFERWDVLLADQYIRYWADNIIQVARLAYNRNVSLYMLDYPSLVSIRDRRVDRTMYVNKTRLTAGFANYQALSKYRISHFLQEISQAVPVIDLESDFIEYYGEDRLALFFDELHLSRHGNKLFAEKLCERLLRETSVGGLKNGTRSGPTTNLNMKSILDLEEKKFQIGSPCKLLQQLVFLEKTKCSNLRGKLIQSNVQQNRYTTF